ncbi:MAG TPA: glycosyltransferase, partial [Acidimicrobiales bacterium]|nr:glycosyltransferase [Acidimicrobiales bacterium]
MTQGVGGGITRHIADIIVNTRGIEHHLAVPPISSSLGSGAAYDRSTVLAMVRQGAEVDHVQMRRNSVDPRNLWSIVQLRRLIRRVDPSLVHAHSSIAGALVRLANLPPAVPVIYTPNGLTTERVGRAVERALAGLASRLVAVSESEAKQARDWGVISPDRLVVIPNGIDVQPAPPGPDLRALLEVPPGTPLVGTMMRLVPQKAPEEFVKVAGAVAKRRSDVHFVLIGMGPLQHRVDAEISRQEVGTSLHQLQHLDGASSVLDQLDVFVLPSRFEGGPYAPLEAMRAGTPVVLSDVVGNTDVIQHGVSGMLAGFGETDQMADAVVTLLEDSDLRRSMVAAARERLQARFDARQMGAAVERLYREVEAERMRRKTRRLPQRRSSASAHSPQS